MRPRPIENCKLLNCMIESSDRMCIHDYDKIEIVMIKFSWFINWLYGVIIKWYVLLLIMIQYHSIQLINDCSDISHKFQIYYECIGRYVAIAKELRDRKFEKLKNVHFFYTKTMYGLHLVKGEKKFARWRKLQS